ncbi:MAG: potassium efflux system protein [Chlamydiales bacterium]|jgi:potassium efflux system protein
MKQQLFKYLVVSVLFFLTVCTQAAYSSVMIEKIQNILSIEVENQAELPNPLNLSPNWWTYFEVEDQILLERTNNYETFLQSLLKEIPIDKYVDAEILINKIMVNLHFLSSPKMSENGTSNLTHFIQKSYNLNDYIHLANQSHLLRLRLEDQKEELGLQNERKASVEKHIENLFTLYNEQEANSLEKLLYGLEIISLRSALAVAKESRDFLRDLISKNTEKLNLLDKAILKASQSLTLDIVAIENIDTKLSELEYALQQNKKELLKAESDTLGNYGETEYDKSLKSYFKQKIVYTSLQGAIFQTKILFLKSQKEYYRLYFTKEKIQERSLLNDWKRNISEITGKIENWSKSSNREKNNAEIFSENLVVESKKNQRNLDERIELANDSLSSIQELKREILNTDLIISLIQNIIFEDMSRIESWWNFLSEISAYSFNQLLSWASISLLVISGIPLTPLGLLRIIFIIWLSFWISKTIQRGLYRFLKTHANLRESTFYIFIKLLHYFILTIGVVTALASIGLDFSNLALIAGALSVGIGFGLQNIFNNFVCGIIILFEGNVRIGHYLEIGPDDIGKVREINIQNTVIETFDGVDVIIPNSDIIGNKVVNWTLRNSFKRIQLPFSVAYGTDKKKVEEVILKATENLEFRSLHYDHKPKIWLVKFGDSSLDFELVLWIDVMKPTRYRSARAKCMWAIESALVENGITIPFPQRDLHFKDSQLPPSS